MILKKNRELNGEELKLDELMDEFQEEKEKVRRGNKSPSFMKLMPVIQKSFK